MKIYKSFIIGLILCFFIQIKCESQSSFYYNLNIDSFGISDMIENNYQLILVGGRRVDDFSSDSAIIIKWTPGGDSLVKKYKPNGYSKINLGRIRKKGDGGYVCFGDLNYMCNPPDTTALLIVGLDSMLNFQWEIIKKIPEGKNIRKIEVCKIENNKWIGSFDIQNIASNLSNIYSFEITETGQLTKFVLNFNNSCSFGDIMIRPNSHGYYVFGGYSSVLNDNPCAMILDTNLCNIGYKIFYPLNTLYSLYYSNIKEEGDTFLLSGNLNGSYIGFSRIKDTDTGLVQIREWRKWDSHGDETVPGNTLTRTNTGNLYFTGNLGPFGCNKVYIEKYDPNFNRLFKKTMHKVDTSLWCYNTLATTDGGLLLTIGYSVCGTFNKIGMYFIKLDGNGQIVWVRENKNIAQKEEYIIYPNPINDIFNVNKLYTNINNTNSCYFDIYDINNKLVFSKQLNISNNEFNIKNLKSDIYFYIIKTNNYIIQTGKILKN